MGDDDSMSSDEGQEDSGTRSQGEGFLDNKPVKVGDELDVTISELSRRGDGVARVQGYVIFVPTGKPGQQARIRVTAVRPSFAVAEVIGAVTS